MRILNSLIFVGIILVVTYVETPAQMCVIPEQKVSRVKGIVAFVGADNRVKGAMISLKHKGERGRNIGEMETDPEGQFEIKGVRKGKYLLIVSYPNAVTLYVPLNLSNRRSDKYLHVILGAIIGETCGGGDVRTVEKI